MRELLVRVKDGHYTIYIAQSLFHADSPVEQDCFRKTAIAKQIMLISNDTVAPLHAQKVLACFSGGKIESFLMKDGESFKSFDTFQQIMEALIKKHYRRNALIVALGGGVVGDISGFAAACYQRGVPFIQIPTTLLAMVDSSVGGKTAINHPLAKNMVGAFYQPKAVFIDLSLLKTLPQRELSAGMAEVIKYGLIDDFSFFEYIEKHIDSALKGDMNVLEHMVYQSCAIKAKVVSMDEKEQGIRAILNLGHTFGHAIEKAGKYTDYIHGEAVAIGMIMAAETAYRLKKVDQEYRDRIVALIERAQLPTNICYPYQVEELISAMRHDKKNQTESIRFVLPTGLGKVAFFDDIEESLIEDVIRKTLT